MFSSIQRKKMSHFYEHTPHNIVFLPKTHKNMNKKLFRDTHGYNHNHVSPTLILALLV